MPFAAKHWQSLIVQGGQPQRRMYEALLMGPVCPVRGEHPAPLIHCLAMPYVLGVINIFPRLKPGDFREGG